MRYKVLREIRVMAMADLSQSFAQRNELILPAGAVFTIVHDPPPNATVVICEAERQESLAARTFPQEGKIKPAGTSLQITVEIEAIKSVCERI